MWQSWGNISNSDRSSIKTLSFKMLERTNLRFWILSHNKIATILHILGQIHYLSITFLQIWIFSITFRVCTNKWWWYVLKEHPYEFLLYIEICTHGNGHRPTSTVKNFNKFLTNASAFCDIAAIVQRIFMVHISTP